MVSTTTAPAFTPVAVGRRRTIALYVVLLASFMDLMDSSVVNVALPPIQHELHTSYETVQWMLTGYTLAFAILQITAGRLGDILGHRAMFLTGVAGFTVASALCGASQNGAQLVGVRVVQGAFAALMVPQVLSILQAMYPPAARGRAMGAFGALAGFATVGGPIIGALLTSGNIAGLGWRAIFYINVPVGVLTLVLGVLFVPRSASTDAARVDGIGVALSTVGLFLVVYPLVQGRAEGWPAWIFGMLVAGLLVLAGFVAHQNRRRRRGASPMLDTGLFRYRSLDGGLLTSLLFMGGVIGFFLIFTVYLQNGLGYGVLHAGLTGIPWGIGVPLFAGVSSGMLTPKLGRVGVQIGILLTVAGMLGLIWTVRDADATSWQFVPALFVGGAGMGLVVAAIVDFTLSEVPISAAGSASGLYNTVQQLAGALSLAGIATVFFNVLGNSGGPVPFTNALRITLWVEVGIFVLAFAASFLLPRKRTS
ncbi:MAG TPA: DHA2 family efflux MFS transporter permease subunit [Pseudonocardiaceae bacterium]|nr:DHA2 family efflux MFS transporter permease subunit [Pseudonocardiaceae bacterium]